jgi:hypothetical protein
MPDKRALSGCNSDKKPRFSFSELQWSSLFDIKCKSARERKREKGPGDV